MCGTSAESGNSPTKYSGENNLQVRFNEKIINGSPNSVPEKNILEQGFDFTLLPCNLAVRRKDEISSLKEPMFYQNDAKEHTFFVEPTVTERTIEEWTDWVPPIDHHVQPSEPEVEFPSELREPYLHYKIITKNDLLDIGVDPKNWMDSIRKMVTQEDIVVNDYTVLEIDGSLVASHGSVGIQTVLASEASSAWTEGGKILPIAGSAGASRVAVLSDGHDLAAMRITPGTAGITVVEKSGINTSSLENFSAKGNKPF